MHSARPERPGRQHAGIMQHLQEPIAVLALAADAMYENRPARGRCKFGKNQPGGRYAQVSFDFDIIEAIAESRFWIPAIADVFRTLWRRPAVTLRRRCTDRQRIPEHP